MSAVDSKGRPVALGDEVLIRHTWGERWEGVAAVYPVPGGHWHVRTGGGTARYAHLSVTRKKGGQ